MGRVISTEGVETMRDGTVVASRGMDMAIETSLNAMYAQGRADGVADGMRQGRKAEESRANQRIREIEGRSDARANKAFDDGVRHGKQEALGAMIISLTQTVFPPEPEVDEDDC